MPVRLMITMIRNVFGSLPGMVKVSMSHIEESLNNLSMLEEGEDSVALTARVFINHGASSSSSSNSIKRVTP